MKYIYVKVMHDFQVKLFHLAEDAVSSYHV